MNEAHITFAAMREFLAPYARKDKKPGIAPRKTSPYIEMYSLDQFKNDILENEKGSLVFFTESKLPIEKQIPIFSKLQKQIKNAL